MKQNEICEAFEFEIHRMVDDEPRSIDDKKFKEHLDSCTNCREELCRIEGLSALMARYPIPPPDLALRKELHSSLSQIQTHPAAGRSGIVLSVVTSITKILVTPLDSLRSFLDRRLDCEMCGAPAGLNLTSCDSCRESELTQIQFRRATPHLALLGLLGLLGFIAVPLLAPGLGFRTLEITRSEDLGTTRPPKALGARVRPAWASGVFDPIEPASCGVRSGARVSSRGSS